MQKICCVCKKTKNRNRWVKKLIASGKALTHGYCPQCYRQVIEKIEGYSGGIELHPCA